MFCSVLFAGRAGDAYSWLEAIDGVLSNHRVQFRRVERMCVCSNARIHRWQVEANQGLGQRCTFWSASTFLDLKHCSHMPPHQSLAVTESSHPLEPNAPSHAVDSRLEQPPCPRLPVFLVVLRNQLPIHEMVGSEWSAPPWLSHTTTSRLSIPGTVNPRMRCGTIWGPVLSRAVKLGRVPR